MITDADILEHGALVENLLLHVCGENPSWCDKESVRQAGFIALIDAIPIFDASRGASLCTYLRIRVSGAMLDEIRKQDWLPRSVRDAVQRGVMDPPVKLSLDQPVNDDNDTLAQIIPGEDECPALGTLRRESITVMMRLIVRLEDRERSIIYHYFFDDLHLWQIAEIHHLTESRICQIVGKLIIHLRAGLKAEGCL